MGNTSTTTRDKQGSSIGLARHGICLYLCCVAPGSEEIVANRLIEQHCSNSDAKTRYVYKLFGRADLALVQLDYDGHNDVVTESDEGIIWSTKCVIYPWEYHSSKALYAFENLPILGITFLKMPHEIIAKYGFDAEQSVVCFAQQQSHHDSPRVELWGLSSACLGWSEVILITLADDAEKMLQYVLEVGSRLTLHLSSGLVVGQEDADESTISIVDSSTIPGIRMTSKGVASGAHCGRVHTNLRVTCVPGTTHIIAADLDKRFGNTSISLGHSDIECISHKCVELGDYVDLLWNFRKLHANSIYTTQTTFTMPFEDCLPSYPDHKNVGSDVLPKPFSYDPTAIRNIGEPTLQVMLEGELAKLRGFITNRHTFGAYFDMLPFVNDLLKEVAEIDWKSHTERELKVLGDTIEMLRHALDQRGIGSVSVGEHFEPSHFSPLGVQRSLLAARFFCRSVMESCLPQSGWGGFIIFGFSSEYKRYSGGIINFPIAASYDPAKFWGAAHEVGHEIGSRLQLLDDGEILYQLDRFGVSKREGLELTWEVFSEIACWLYGFGRHRWPLFVEHVWRYFGEQHRIEEHIDLYLSRFILTAAYMKHLEEGITLPPDEEVIKRIADEMDQVLISAAPNIRKSLQGDLRKKAIERSQALSNVLPLMHERFWEPLLQHYSYPSEQTVYRDFIKEGKIAPELRNPADLIMRLIEDHDAGTRERAAILLTFWNQEVRRLAQAD